MAGNIAQVRMQKECKEIVMSKELQENGISIEVLNEQLSRIQGFIRGPPDSPYEGATYKLEILIPGEYPFEPPKVKFLTKIWHPNISSQTGAICLDVLKEAWAASMTLRTVLLSVQSLLAAPEPKDPQDAVVAGQFLENHALYTATAKFWAQHYAGAAGEKNTSMMTKCEKLKEMGVSIEQAIQTLSCNKWNLDKAMECIFD